MFFELLRFAIECALCRAKDQCAITAIFVLVFALRVAAELHQPAAFGLQTRDNSLAPQIPRAAFSRALHIVPFQEPQHGRRRDLGLHAKRAILLIFLSPQSNAGHKVKPAAFFVGLIRGAQLETQRRLVASDKGEFQPGLALWSDNRQAIGMQHGRFIEEYFAAGTKQADGDDLTTVGRDDRFNFHALDPHLLDRRHRHVHFGAELGHGRQAKGAFEDQVIFRFAARPATGPLAQLQQRLLLGREDSVQRWSMLVLAQLQMQRNDLAAFLENAFGPGPVDRRAEETPRFVEARLQPLGQAAVVRLAGPQFEVIQDVVVRIALIAGSA